MNLQNLSKQEMCAALAQNDEPNFDEFMLVCTFVKMLGAAEALYLVAINDDEGPNPYEGVCVNFVHVQCVAGKLSGEWAQEWVGAQ